MNESINLNAMNIKIPNTTNVIKERGRQLTKYIFDYEYDLIEPDADTPNYIALVRTKYLGTKLYRIAFYIILAKDRSQIEFMDIDCNCPHQVDVCKHMYAAILSLSKSKREIQNLYDQFEIQDMELEEAASLNTDDDLDLWVVDEHNDQPFANVTSKMASDYTERLLDTTLLNTMAVFEREQYQFIPELVINDKEFGLKLKLGIIGGKSFVIKDIYELPKLFQNKLGQTFGSNTEVMFIREKFKNKPLVDFLITEINRGCALLNTVSSRGKTDWYGYYTPGKIQYDKKQLQLSPGTLLAYLELMDGSTIRFKYEQERVTDYTISPAASQYELEVEGFEGYATVEGKEVLQFIQCLNKVIIIDPTYKQISILELETRAMAEALCILFNYPHIINSDNAHTINETILKPLAKYIKYDFDFAKLHADLFFVGFRANLYLDKNRLNIQININADKEPPTEDITLALDTTSYILVDHLLEMYDQPRFDTTSPEPSEFTIKGVNNIIDFVNDHLKPMEQIFEVITSNEEFKNFKIVEKLPVQITQTRSKGKSILKFESSEFSDSELLEIFKAISEAEEYAQLTGGKILDLSSSEVKDVIDAANKLDLDLAKAKSTEIEVELASIFYYNKIFDSLNVLVSKDQVIDQLVIDYNNIDDKFRKPKNLDAKLRNYQKYGVNWLSFLEQYGFGGILADDMGLGKTLQVISHLATNKSKLPRLIITPASLIYNWKYEFEKFTKNSNLLVIDGKVSERKQLIEEITNQTCIISYDTFKRDYELLADYKYNYLILDEAQHIKNANTKVAKAVKAVDSEHRLALTGTPIENNLNELWSLFDFIMPSFLGSNKDFKRQFITPIENGDLNVQDKLKQKISPFILRRLKGEVLTELPAKTEKVIHIKMQADQQKLYDSYAMELKNFLNKTSEDEMRTKQIEVLAMITKLRQIACNPILQNEQYKGSNSKQEYLIEHLETLIENNHKTVLFSQFVSNFKYIEAELDKRGIKYCKITGQTPKQKRFEMVDSFNQDDTPIFLISLKAGGTGLNITGADTVIHYDPWWNTAVESQATDRVHRMGQKNSVFVYKLICEKTIEQQIVELQEQKRKLSESLLDADDIKSSSLTKDEVLALL